MIYWNLPLYALGLRRLHSTVSGPSVSCQSTHALDRLVDTPCASRRSAHETKNQYVFMVSDLCRGGGGAPIRDGDRDRIRSCQESYTAFFDEAKYAIASLQATGAEHGITVLMHQGLQNKAGALDSFLSWLHNRSVTVQFVPGKADDAHMYYFMKSYLWDMSFEKVAYFDTDFVFLRNPDHVFSVCWQEFCAAPAVSATGEAIMAHMLAGDPSFSKQMSQRGSQWRRPNTKNAWNAGFFVLTPNKARGAQIFETWKKCEGAENYCLNQAISAVQAVSPIYNLQHSTLEGRSIKVHSMPTVAIHGKVGRMTCEAIDKEFGQARC